MSLLAWIILGMITGFIASKVIDHSSQGARLDIVLGVVGAVSGGWLCTRLGVEEVPGVNLYSLLVAALGSIFFLVLYHAGVRGALRQGGAREPDPSA